MTLAVSRHWQAWLGSACLGAMTVTAFAPFSLWWLAAPMLAGWYVLLSGAGPRQATLLGAAFGLGHFLVGVSWVYVSLHDVGGMPLPLAVVATLLFAAVLATFPALAGGLFGRLGNASQQPLLRAAVFAAAWTGAEWLRSWVFTGFPWLTLGSSQTAGPLAGWLPVVGALGTSFLLALLGGLLGELAIAWRQPARGLRLLMLAPPILAVPLIGALLGLARWTEPVGAPLSVALLQGNVEQSLKWQPERFRDSLRTYFELQRDHPATLTVLPETALPAFYEELPPDYLAALRRLAARQPEGAVLLGVPLGDEGRYENGAVLLAAAAESSPAPQANPATSYRKRHLVPFGEFVPAGFAWFLRFINMPLSGFTPGPADQPPLAVGGQQLAVNICYEDVFADEIAARALSATVLVNLSNTAWFGHSLAQPQHLQIAQSRALETGRPMLRATNTGMTALVAPDGRVLAALPSFTRDALVVEVQGRTGLTPFLRWGHGPVLVLVGLLLAWAGWRSRARPA